MLKLLVVEDHVLIRDGLIGTLGMIAEDGEEVSARGAATAEEAIQLIDADDDIDLIVLDLMLPGTGGIGLLGALRNRHQAIPVLVLSAMDDPATVKRAINLGAAGFVSKSSDTQTLIGAIREVLAGGRHIPDQYNEAPTKRRPVPDRFGLTPAQTRVLEFLIEGKTNREIGDLNGIAEGTVKLHVKAILKAMNVPSRAQAVVVATRAGMKGSSLR